MPEIDYSLHMRSFETRLDKVERASLNHNDGGGTSGGMESPIAKLEANVENIKEAVRDLKADGRELRTKVDNHFLILSGMIITVAVGIASLLAKSFHWIG